MVRSRSMVRFWCLSIDSLPLVGDISYISSVVIGVVSHVLGSTVREKDGVGSLNRLLHIVSTVNETNLDVPVGIGHLASVEVSAVVVIVDSVLELVGGGLLLVDRSWGVIGWVACHGTGGPHEGQEIQQ